MMTIKGPAIPGHQPGSCKFFDIYNTTNRLTYHLVDQAAADFYNAPIADFTPQLPERGFMYDTAVFLKPTADRIPRMFVMNTLQNYGKTEMSEKYLMPRRQFLQTLIPRHKYLEDWNNRDMRFMSQMYISEYNYFIGDKSPTAKILPMRGRFVHTNEGKNNERRTVR